MEPARCLVMNVRRIQLLLLPATLLVLVCVLVPGRMEDTRVNPIPETVVIRAQESEPLPVVSHPAPEAHHAVEPVVAEAIKHPVQSVENRRDAMLFESEALFGTPFDQAIVMPFD